MFRFLSRSLPHLKSYSRTSQTHNLAFLQLNQFSSASLGTSKSIADKDKKRSFTVNYLIEKCGFAPEMAVSASKRCSFETPEKPDSVISFFKDQKFTESQISNILKFVPPVLLCDPEETLLPKIGFLKSLGFSLADLTGILSKAPPIFRRNLEKHLIPSVEYIKGIVKSDEKTIGCLKLFPLILLCDHRPNLVANISMLREIGVPEANIAFLVANQPSKCYIKCAKFKRTVEKVQGLGFRSENLNFLLALHILAGMSTRTWEKKVQVFKKWGWSDSEILEAFGKQPWFMSTSKDKITRVMDFFVKQIGLERSVLLRRPFLLGLSLEKRIKPRWIFYKALLSKGLLKRKFSIGFMLEIPEKKFLEKFVERYKAEAPELLDIYKKNFPL